MVFGYVEVFGEVVDFGFVAYGAVNFCFGCFAEGDGCVAEAAAG